MKNLVIIFTLALVVNSVRAQNLIPNADFESFSSLPNDISQYYECDSWGNASSSVGDPDYFHANAGILADLPITSVAEITAYSGDAIMGFIGCGKQGSNFREYLNVKLTQPLVPGNKYNLTFKISNGEVFDYSLGGFGVDNFGVHFSANQVVQNQNDPISVVPEFEIQQVTFARDWEEISFSFVADQAHEWMTLGLFGDDSDKTVTFYEGSSSLAEYAYYFVDDFKLEEIPNETLEAENDRDIPEDNVVTILGDFPFFVPNAFTPDSDGQNDMFEIVSSDPKTEFSVLVFDRWGNQIYEAVNGQPAWDGRCNGSICPNDVYVWLVRYSIVNSEGDVVQKEESGTVHLIK